VRCRSAAKDVSEVGSVTAEFATVIPAVVVVLAMSLGGIQLATRQLQLHDAAALAARSAARGSDANVVVGSLLRGARAHTELRGNLVCVSVEIEGTSLSVVLGAVTLTATSCALAGGQ